MTEKKSFYNESLCNTHMLFCNHANDRMQKGCFPCCNVMLTFPYSHDGRFYSIGAAIDHYRTGIITTQATLDPLLANRIAITNIEKNDLVYFLHTLTDTTMTKAARFAQ